MTALPSLRAALLLPALLAAGCQQPARVADPAPAAEVTVEFRSPEQFTDFDDGVSVGGRTTPDYAAAVRRILTEEARRHLRPGERLAVVFTDIDLAGDTRLSVRRSAPDLRVVEDIYPPRLELTFTLTDAQGRVLKEGPRTLTARGFNVGVNRTLGPDLPFEHALLRDWLRSELRGTPAS